MCGSMADIQSAAAEIRRGKKRKKKGQTAGWKYNGLPYSIGRPKSDTRGNKYKLLNHTFHYDTRKYSFTARIVKK